MTATQTERVRLVLDKLEKLRKYGSGWLACCPAHDDHTPSLKIDVDDGRVLLHCYAGCEPDDVLQAIGLSWADISPDADNRERINGDSQPENAATYDYRDESGQTLYQVVRTNPKGFYQRRPNGGGYLNGLGNVGRVLYRLPELIASDPAEPVWITEGEKDSERLASLGYVATTNAAGAKNWRAEYNESLRGRSVVILEDNDPAGRDRVRMIGQALSDVAADIRVVTFRDLPEHADVSDWLDAGGVAADLASLAMPYIDWTAGNDQSEPATEPVMPTAPSWPAQPNLAAFYGLAGEIVDALDPTTEADRVAILGSLLSAVGNIVGYGPHWQVSGTRHGLRLNLVFVGDTAKGRKGTSWGSLRPLLERAAPDWYRHRLASGVSSGEGLIWAVRDPIVKTEPIKEKGQVTGYQDVTVDAGVEDKRLFVIEAEFARVLRVMQRDGNSLSAIIRDAWDHGQLSTLTKNSPARATGAHITIMGHVTKDELLRYLDNTEAANGYANRHLWLCVRRSKILPDGGTLDGDTLFQLSERLAHVFETARHTALIARDPDASAIWNTVYEPLSEGGYGLMGAILARAEAQVMRLATIYAVLDCERVIRSAHLRAALALWDYAEASARYIFGDTLGDPTADTILNALRTSGPLSRNDIVDLFGRNVNRARLDRALGLLLTAGRVRSYREGTAGRPRDMWAAL